LLVKANDKPEVAPEGGATNKTGNVTGAPGKDVNRKRRRDSASPSDADGMFFFRAFLILAHRSKRKGGVKGNAETLKKKPRRKG
jgi:hypothetical protein